MLLGAHVSTAGGCRNAPARAADIGASAIQVFTKQPNRWAEVQLVDDECQAFRTRLIEHRAHIRLHGDDPAEVKDWRAVTPG